MIPTFKYIRVWCLILWFYTLPRRPPSCDLAVWVTNTLSSLVSDNGATQSKLLSLLRPRRAAQPRRELKHPPKSLIHLLRSAKVV